MKHTQHKSNDMVKAFWLGFTIGVVFMLLANIVFSQAVNDFTDLEAKERCPTIVK